MLSAVAIPGIDYRHRRDFSRARGSSCLMMANDDDVAVAADDANRILDLLGFNFRRKRARMFSGEHAAPQSMHRRFEGEPGSRGGLVKDTRENTALVIQRAA